MSDLIVEMIVLLMLVLCCVLFGWGTYEEHEAMLSKKTIQDYVTQIDQLHADAIKANEESNQAWLAASKAMQLANDRSKQLMKQKVPHDCNKAIQWGIIQAKKI